MLPRPTLAAPSPVSAGPGAIALAALWLALAGCDTPSRGEPASNADAATTADTPTGQDAAARAAADATGDVAAGDVSTGEGDGRGGTGGTECPARGGPADCPNGTGGTECPARGGPAECPNEGEGEGQGEASTLTVATLNLRCLVEGWAARLPVIADALAEVDPDVLLLQEVCEEAGVLDALAALTEALAERTGEAYVARRAVTHRAWDRYDEGVAVLSRLPIRRGDVVALPSGVFPRRLVLVRVDAPGGALVVGGTHLDHQSAETRARQARAIVEAVDAFAEEGEPVVLGGDLNEPPDGPALVVLTEAGYLDAWQTLHPLQAGPTFPASSPARRIDYVLVRPAPDGTPTPVETDRVRWPDGGPDGSDHLGVATRLEGGAAGR